MLRAKSYKKKLKKSQIKLRKHKTYSIKGGNRNNNSRSKKKQKGGTPFEAPDGKTYQTPEEYERYKELKEVFEKRRRRNERRRSSFLFQCNLIKKKMIIFILFFFYLEAR